MRSRSSGSSPSLLDDCILMASELAANTLHARAVAGAGGGGDQLVSVVTDMGGELITSASPPPRPAVTPRTLALPAGSWRPAGAGLQGLRFLPRLAARFRAFGIAGVGPGRDRARPADRARTVARPVGASSHPGQAGRLGASRQSRLVRGARSARARPPGGRDRAAGVYALGRCHGRPGQRAGSARARPPGNSREMLTRAGVQRAGWCGPTSRRLQRHVGPFRLPRPDRVVPVRRGVARPPAEGPSDRWNYADLVEATEQTVRLYEELELGGELVAAQ